MDNEEINFVIRALVMVTIWSLILKAVGNITKPKTNHSIDDVKLWDEESNPEMTKREKSENSLTNSGEERKKIERIHKSSMDWNCDLEFLEKFVY